MRKKICIFVLVITGGLLVFSSQNSWCWVGSSYSIRTMVQHSQGNNAMVQHSVVIGHTSWGGPDLTPSHGSGQVQGDIETQTADPGSGAGGAKVISQEKGKNPNTFK